jgi:hypothetical protein
MSLLWTLPLAAQGLLMGADELWFHRRRGLPLWERIGHPIDTGSVLACLGFAWLCPVSPATLWTYLTLAAFSCALVTKDEPVHAVRCSAAEHWIHAALFVLHPIVLAVSALLWTAREQHPIAEVVGRSSGLAVPDAALAGAVLLAQGALVTGFGLYQALYWSCRSR